MFASSNVNFVVIEFSEVTETKGPLYGILKYFNCLRYFIMHTLLNTIFKFCTNQNLHTHTIYLNI